MTDTTLILIVLVLFWIIQLLTYWLDRLRFEIMKMQIDHCIKCLDLLVQDDGEPDSGDSLPSSKPAKVIVH